MSRRIIRLPAVMDRTGLARSTVYARMKKKEFPLQVKQGDSQGEHSCSKNFRTTS